MPPKPPYRPIRFTRPVLAALFLALAGSLGAAAVGRMYPQSTLPTGATVQVRELLFTDGADGAVVVRQAGQEQPVAELTGEQGFLRGTLRGLARTRKAEGIGADVPFRLVAWADGRLTLEDPATGRVLDLSAFGPQNTAVFGQLLTAGVHSGARS